jgi:hypothetical protein
VAKGKDKSQWRLSVFKGREARLNRAIFHTLALKSPQTIYDIHKEARKQKGLRRVRYASLNRRVRLLKESGYIKEVGIKKTKAGFKASEYELSIRAYLAMLLNATNMNDLLAKIDESTAETVLTSILQTIDPSV